MPEHTPSESDAEADGEAGIGFPVRRPGSTDSPSSADARRALRQLIEENPDAIVVVTDDDRLHYCNAAAETLFGQDALELQSQPFTLPWRDASGAELELERADGRKCMVEPRVTFTRWDGRDAAILSLRDVSDRVRLEAKLRQAQKMEALGRLAGGVAHDFNNILTVIMTSAELLRARLADGSSDARHAAQIVGAAETAAEMTQKLLTFSRDKLTQAQTLDVNGEVTATLELMRRLVGEHIDFVTELTPDAPQIHLAASDLQQILINLVVNARDAMKGGGEITISTSVVAGTGEDDATYIGRYARIGVRDTGCGMDDQTRASIFEPFFSTKTDKQGSGLGLATVNAIVRQAQGHVRVLSRPGQGTCFYIDLPLWDEAVESVEEPELPAPRPAREPAKRVALVVEDQHQVRALVCEILRANDYEVHAAEDGQRALTLARELGGDLALLVTDIMLPGTTGAELCALVREELPELPIVVMSGYAAETHELARVAGAGVACLPKPFTPQQLMAEVGSVTSPEP